MKKLTRQQKLDLELLNTQFLASIEGEYLELEALDNWMYSVRLWYIVACHMGKHSKFLHDQVLFAEKMVFQAKHSNLSLLGSQVEDLRQAVIVMRQLANKVTQHTASVAAAAAERQANNFLKENRL